MFIFNIILKLLMIVSYIFSLILPIISLILSIKDIKNVSKSNEIPQKEKFSVLFKYSKYSKFRIILVYFMLSIQNLFLFAFTIRETTKVNIRDIISLFKFNEISYNPYLYSSLLTIFVLLIYIICLHSNYKFKNKEKSKRNKIKKSKKSINSKPSRILLIPILLLLITLLSNLLTEKYNTSNYIAFSTLIITIIFSLFNNGNDKIVNELQEIKSILNNDELNNQDNKSNN